MLHTNFINRMQAQTTQQVLKHVRRLKKLIKFVQILKKAEATNFKKCIKLCKMNAGKIKKLHANFVKQMQTQKQTTLKDI